MVADANAVNQKCFKASLPLVKRNVVFSTITVKLDLLFAVVRCEPEFILTT